jgi:energy-coupling factor transport system permease protein
MNRALQDISIGGYLPGDSALHRLDPRTKLAGFVALLVCVFTAGSGVALAVSGVAVTALASASMAGIKVWWWGLGRFLWMLAMAAGLNAFLHSDGVPISVVGYELPFTHEGVCAGLWFSAQLTLAILLSMTLTFTTTPRDLTRGCEKLASPLERFNVRVGEIGVVLLLAMRFVPLLQLELRSIVDAQKSRGIDLSHGGLAERSRNLVAVLVPALLGTLRRGDRLAEAMATRGFQPDAPRSDFRPLRFNRGDCVAFAGITVFFLCHMFWLR